AGGPGADPPIGWASASIRRGGAGAGVLHIADTDPRALPVSDAGIAGDERRHRPPSADRAADSDGLRDAEYPRHAARLLDACLRCDRTIVAATRPGGAEYPDAGGAARAPVRHQPGSAARG